MKNQRLRLSAEFAKLRPFLTEEEQLFLQRLSQEEEETKKKQREKTLRLSQMVSALKQLISEVKEKSQSPELELLQVRGWETGSPALRGFPGHHSPSSLLSLELHVLPGEWV